MRFHPIALCLSLGALAACRSTHPAADGPQPFSRAFEAYETRRGSDSTGKPKTTLIDYDSEILVRPDRGRLAAVAGLGGASTPSAEIARAQERLADVGRIEAVLSSIAQYEEESQRFFTDDFAEGMVLQDDARWRSLTEKQLEIVVSLKNLVYIYLNQTRYDGKWNWSASDPAAMGIAESEVPEAFASVDPLYRKLSPTADTFDPAEVTKLVNETTRALRERIAELERAILQDSPKATLEMEAALLRNKERLPVSITPYTIVEGVGRGEKSQRVGIPSQEDVERVQKEYEAYSELADSINELVEIAGDKEKLKELRDGILNALRTLAENLGNGLEAELKELIETPELAAVRADAEAVLAELEAVLGAVRELRDGASSSDPITLSNDAITVLARIRDGGLQTKLATLVAGLGALPATLPETARALAASVASLAEAEATQLEAALANQPAAGSVANLYASLRKLSSLAELRSFGDLEGGKITRRPFALDQAPDGLVNLADTPAESGDVLELKYEVNVDLEGGAAGAKPEEYHGAQFLDVRKFGFYSTYSAQVIFFDRLNDGSSSYRAAPGVAYNLHYRPEGAQKLYDFLGPGIGLSVSAPSFENGTELAVGLQATLFNDIVQAGYAYNISVGSDPWMFYFAFDLIASFQAIE